MFAIIDTTNREVLEIKEERPSKNLYSSPLLVVYITSVEASNLVTPLDEWVPDPDLPEVYNKVHTPGTIVPQTTLNAAITRQDNLKIRVNLVLTFANSLNGRTFDSLTNQELKGLMQLQLAMNGMIDINGNIDLSDFTVDTISN